jgi:ketosteroid isomerase-like protein
MKKILLPVFIMCLGVSSKAQNKSKDDSSYLVTLTQQVDDAVVKQDTHFLKKIYADDFVFSHGSGRVEGRDGWIRSVAKGGFTIRTHDSVTVELHGEIAIVKGILHVKKQGKEKLDSYHLRYLKVYVLRKGNWQMISHSTVSEYHD